MTTNITKPIAFITTTQSESNTLISFWGTEKSISALISNTKLATFKVELNDIITTMTDTEPYEIGNPLDMVYIGEISYIITGKTLDTGLIYIIIVTKPDASNIDYYIVHSIKSFAQNVYDEIPDL